ncbi:MAG: DUF5009 domain-containing protein [Bacteroidales bacterium]|nr:DUF5009 domain-containing protein [Bacteroidales bacterium]
MGKEYYFDKYLQQRNVAIDLLRAITMVTMLMVNDFWSVGGIPHWMCHAESGEDMLGFADVVFPTFLFCVGLSIPYAISAMRSKGRDGIGIVSHIGFRSVALLVMGSFICNQENGIDPSVGYSGNWYNIIMTVGFVLAFNYYQGDGWGVRMCKIAGWALLLLLAVTSRSPEGMSFYPYWWGILGLIGWAYLFCAMAYALTTRTSTRIVVWLVLFAICLCCTETASYSMFEGKSILPMGGQNVIKLIITNLHIDNGSTHLMVMSGVLFSSIYVKVAAGWGMKQKILRALALSGLCVVAGVVSHEVFITSKLIGTLPWVFYTLAIDVVLYAMLDWMVSRDWTGPLQWLKPAGTATLTCYLMPYVLYPIISMTLGWDWSYAIGAPWGIVKCLAFAMLCVGLTGVLNRYGVKLKI